MEHEKLSKKQLEKKLTEKQKLFCKYYVNSGWNLTNAAISAGYSKKTAYAIGSENLKKPEILQYIELIRNDIEFLAGISKGKNAIRLNEIADKSEKDSDKTKAIAELNKMLGYNEPEKHEITDKTPPQNHHVIFHNYKKKKK